MGKEKVENRKERETAERGLGFSNIYLHLSVLEEVFFALMFFFLLGLLFFFFNTVLTLKIVGASKASVIYIY